MLDGSTKKPASSTHRKLHHRQKLFKTVCSSKSEKCFQNDEPVIESQYKINFLIEWFLVVVEVEVVNITLV